MVRGFESFKDWFAGYEDQYIIIGGTSCDILMSEDERAFRATKDIDLVLIAETLTAEFGRRFWDYIEEGGYQNKNKSSGEPQRFRFANPSKAGFPVMIELFSRRIDSVNLPDYAVLTPMSLDDGLSSLSAILVVDDYYNFMRAGKIIVDGVPVLGVAYIISLKAKAWLDLSEKRAAGEVINSKNIRKHKNDVFRLSELIAPDLTVTVPDTIRADLDKFFNAMKGENIDLKSLGVGGGSQEDVLEKIMRVYR